MDNPIFKKSITRNIFWEWLKLYMERKGTPLIIIGQYEDGKYALNTKLGETETIERLEIIVIALRKAQSRIITT